VEGRPIAGVALSKDRETFKIRKYVRNHGEVVRPWIVVNMAFESTGRYDMIRYGSQRYV